MRELRESQTMPWWTCHEVISLHLRLSVSLIYKFIFVTFPVPSVGCQFFCLILTLFLIKQFLSNLADKCISNISSLKSLLTYCSEHCFYYYIERKKCFIYFPILKVVKSLLLSRFLYMFYFYKLQNGLS